MNQLDIGRHFSGILRDSPETSSALAAMQTMLKVLEDNKAETVQELHSNLKEAIEAMKKTDNPVTGVISGCELFMRFVTLTQLDTEPFDKCKAVMIDRGKMFLKKLMESRDKIAKLGAAFITDGCKVLTHSRSRVILKTLKAAVEANKRFQVYVTKSSPDNSGEQMAKELEKANIPCTVILDSAVGYVMEGVDLVMVGAEGVVESGGIINKIGTYTMALCAREMKKPFYVLAESFKFVRLYPLNQHDLPDEFKYTIRKSDSDLSKQHPMVDYTPPAYITLLFTDLGILTPSAVSDELIKLYL